MFSNRELWQFGFLDCDYCIYQRNSKLCHRHSRTCNFCPQDWDLFISVVITNLRMCVPKETKKSYLTMCRSDKDTILQNWFYTQLVNDSLKEIRKGNVAYVFSLYHIRDIIRFEPNISVHYIPSANTFSVILLK